MTTKEYFDQALYCADDKTVSSMNKAVSGERFLESIRHLDREIAALDHERVRLSSCRQDILDKARSLSGSFDGVHVQHGPSNRTESIGLELASVPDVESLVKKLNAYQQRINCMIDELVDRKQKALDIIERIPDARYRALLIHRYLSNLLWTAIAGLMGYTDTYVRLSLKDEAIREFEQVWKLPSK